MNQPACSHQWVHSTEYQAKSVNPKFVYFRDVSTCAKCGIVSRGLIHRALRPARKPR